MKASVEQEIQRILPLIPKEPPEHSIDTLKKRGFLKDERLLYKIAYGVNRLHGSNALPRAGKSVYVKCSRCGGEAFLEYVGNNGCCHYGQATYGFIDPLDNSKITNGGTCVCPMCGIGLRALHTGSFKSCTDIDSRIYASVHNVEGHLAVLSWITKKNLHSDGSVTYFTNGYEGVIVIEKTLVRIKMYHKFMSSYSWDWEWSYTKRCDDEFGSFSPLEIVEATAATVERTECAHSALAEYMNARGNVKIAPARYLKIWLKHPNVENLIRQGLSRYVSSIMEKAEGYTSYYHISFDMKNMDQYINWKKVKPHEMLGLSKEELKLARSVSFDALEFYREIKERKGLRLDERTLNVINKWGYYSVRTLVCTPIYNYSVPLIHVINYLEKQKEASARKDLISVRYLEDYWNSLYKVHSAMVSELLYPKDLQKAHDDMLTRVKEKESAELNAKIKARLSELALLSYSSETTGLLIRPAASQAELIAEGATLHHCVGGYAKDHANGKTSIFFIRKATEPNIPFYTLEYKNGAVQQNRGDRNCARTPEVIAFEKEWLEHIKNKEFMNNGKLSNRNQERVRAGA